MNYKKEHKKQHILIMVERKSSQKPGKYSIYEKSSQ
jgi:hypothetical protein